MRLVLLLLLALPVLASDLTIESVHVQDPGVNHFVVISNGAIWIPPWQFPTAGGDGIAGSINFTLPGHPIPDRACSRYILNLTGSPGDGRVQMLLSHHSIYLEEEPNGTICFGNDGTAGGNIEIRYEDAFGTMLLTNVPGHSHVMEFSARLKDANGVIHQSMPAIVAFHGGNPVDYYPGNPRGDQGRASDGELAFFTHTPFPLSYAQMIPGTEMGRMVTNGWQLHGPIYRDYSSDQGIILSTMTTISFDVATNYFWERTVHGLTTVTMTNSAVRAAAVQEAKLLLCSPDITSAITWPGWTQMNALPTQLAAGQRAMVELFITPRGTYARGTVWTK